MQSAFSLSSISSSTSSYSSTSYASRTILEAKDLPSAAPRCRFQLPVNNKSMSKCRHLFRTCLSSILSPLSLPIQTKLSDSSIRKQYFAKLCHHYRLLLVLNDYECKCGCHFSMRQGTFVILYETRNELSMSNKNKLVTVISNELVCLKVPSEYVCDIELLREHVRTRHFYSDD
ncbi:unnamed protein product [Rotaria sp. Silwood2]|nr:unnamed protein product [Rotaria sp. Silwood2]CAF2963275.1 unnamed protein product [Rotaria sp. Silwood2]CAF3329413.1 unnamed protein product [Rotaria sp. Silwood2]CAF3957010.1 unnamed protein product [Rotaria sp. Silwood2]CAF3979884.1 unnamed protein product [Rotaria sp. Silwood2]